MLKNRSGEAVPAVPTGGDPAPHAPTPSLTETEKPRKKLSFRDPEVIVPHRNGPNSAPSILMKGSSASLGRPNLTRPHSVTGVIGLGGLSSSGFSHSWGSSSMPPSPSSTLNSGTSRHYREGSPSYHGRGYSSRSHDHSPSRSLPKHHGRPHSVEGQRHPHGLSDRGRSVEDPLVRSSLKSGKKQVTYPGRLHRESSPAREGSHSRQNSLQEPATSGAVASEAIPNGRAAPDSGANPNDGELENQAMKVVRTVGQAFEVCHKIATKERSPSPDPTQQTPHPDDLISQEGSEVSSDKPKKDGLDSESGQEDLLTLTSAEDCSEPAINRPTRLESLAPSLESDIHRNPMLPLGQTSAVGDCLPQAGTALSVQHELQLMREQMEQQGQQTQAAVAQVHLLRDQLAAETAARLEAQARTHQLLVHNKELLEHIQQLVLQVRELEVKLYSGGGGSSSLPADRNPLQVPPNLPDLNLQAPMQKAATAQPPLQVSNSNIQHQQRQQHLKQLQEQQVILSSQQVRQKVQLLPQQQQQQKVQLRAEDSCSSTPSLSSESDPRISCQSSGENIAAAAALSQIYNMDPRRLPQVPEDSVPLTPYGPIPLGSARGTFNSPITRAASERAARRETLAQLQRMEWMRHTTR